MSLCKQLWAACKRGDSAAVVRLLDEGADIKGQEGSMLEPLACAAKHGQADVVRLLLERGARVNSDHGGSHALFQACASQKIEVAGILADKGADLDAAWVRGGMPPMEYCVAYGKRHAVAFLLGRGARTDGRSASGDLLYTAIQRRDLAIVKLLAPHFVLDVPQEQTLHHRETRGETYLQCALRRRYYKCVVALVEAGATLDTAQLERLPIGGRLQIERPLAKRAKQTKRSAAKAAEREREGRGESAV